MSSYNKVLLMGYLTRDPEMKYLPSGTAVANFGIAINEGWTDKSTGEKKESATFVDVEAWDRQAEIINEYFSKGDPIFIDGALKFESWEAEDGSKRNRLKVRLIRLHFIGGKGSFVEDKTEEYVKPTTESEPAPANSEDEEGIPF